MTNGWRKVSPNISYNSSFFHLSRFFYPIDKYEIFPKIYSIRQFNSVKGAVAIDIYQYDSLWQFRYTAPSSGHITFVHCKLLLKVFDGICSWHFILPCFYSLSASRLVVSPGAYRDFTWEANGIIKRGIWCCHISVMESCTPRAHIALSNSK